MAPKQSKQLSNKIDQILRDNKDSDSYSLLKELAPTINYDEDDIVPESIDAFNDLTISMSHEEINQKLFAELLNLMPIKSDGEWGPQPIKCRWCGAWLDYDDGRSKRKPEELHKANCFAALYLGRPIHP